MILFLFLFGLALGAVTPPDDQGVKLGAVIPPDNQAVKLQRGGCPVFWFGFNGRCYRYMATRLSWAHAELRCVSLGANLVSIHSIQERDFVSSLIGNFDSARTLTWIGLSDLHLERRWMWSDGSGVGFVFWQRGEPSNLGGQEHCVHTNFGAGFKWNDTPCSRIYPFVCASRTRSP